MSETALDALIAHLAEATTWNSAVDASPVALVWCDPSSECEPIMPALRSRLPQLLTLGKHSAEIRSGPAFWLRAAVERCAEGLDLPEGHVPIVWLPGVPRDQLRGAEDCAPTIAPLVWFVVGGQLYGHRNGKDWTLRALFGSDHGPLRLDIADDALTRAALRRAAPRMLNQPLSELRLRHWNADALDALLSGDPDADLLDWIDGALTSEVDADRFAAFAARAKKEFGIEPSVATPEQGARLLAERSGNWGRVWRRFATSAGHNKVMERLNAIEPPADFLTDTSAYPKANAAAEDELRRELLTLHKLDVSAACDRVLQLEAKHAPRRDGAWARRGLTPLAYALRHLAIIAAAAPLPDGDASNLGNAYFADGWRVDRAALEAYAAAPKEVDRNAVGSALRVLYLPWLQEGCMALQEIARAGRVPFARPSTYSGPDTLVFVDGLRLDLAHILLERLEQSGAHANLSWIWSGFPTVTATCKPLVSPIADTLAGQEIGPDFLPSSPEGRPANKAVLDKLMTAAGWSVGGSPLPNQPLWLETGRFDTDGHAFEDRLADQISAATDDLVEQLLDLARAGRKLRIVTDHGWVWLPGGLPKIELPAGLAQNDGKRTRCALLKEGVEARFARIPWTWNECTSVAAASGASSFYKSYAYAHGGVSPQECILPVLEVASARSALAVRILKADWTGLRLRVEVEGGADRAVDLRATSGASLLPALRALDESGKTSFPVSSDYEGETAILVVLGEDGLILAERKLTVGQVDG